MAGGDEDGSGRERVADSADPGWDLRTCIPMKFLNDEAAGLVPRSGHECRLVLRSGHEPPYLRSPGSQGVRSRCPQEWPVSEATSFTFPNLHFLPWVRVRPVKAGLREDVREQSISSAKKCAQSAEALLPGYHRLLPRGRLGLSGLD